jgi:hypothetical protein
LSGRIVAATGALPVDAAQARGGSAAGLLGRPLAADVGAHAINADLDRPVSVRG